MKTNMKLFGGLGLAILLASCNAAGAKTVDVGDYQDRIDAIAAAEEAMELPPEAMGMDLVTNQKYYLDGELAYDSAYKLSATYVTDKDFLTYRVEDGEEYQQVWEYYDSKTHTIYEASEKFEEGMEAAEKIYSATDVSELATDEEIHASFVEMIPSFVADFGDSNYLVTGEAWDELVNYYVGLYVDEEAFETFAADWDDVELDISIKSSGADHIRVEGKLDCAVKEELMAYEEGEVPEGEENYVATRAVTTETASLKGEVKKNLVTLISAQMVFEQTGTELDAEGQVTGTNTMKVEQEEEVTFNYSPKAVYPNLSEFTLAE